MPRPGRVGGVRAARRPIERCEAGAKLGLQFADAKRRPASAISRARPTAVAVDPTDERYQALVGQMYAGGFGTEKDYHQARR